MKTKDLNSKVLQFLGLPLLVYIFVFYIALYGRENENFIPARQRD